MKTNPYPLLTFIVVLSAAAPMSHAQTVYSSGHADIGVAYEEEGLFVHYHFGGDAQLNGVISGEESEYAIPDVLTHIPLTLGSMAEVPATPYNQAWGLPAGGGAIYYIPQVQVADVPWLGFGTDELDPTDWIGNFTFKLESVSGPGEFSLWTTGVFGEPTFYYSTNHAAGTANGNNTMVLGFTHAHANWGFTETGLYDITLTVSATHAVDGPVSSTQTLHFAVGAVPEPASATMLLLGGLCLASRRRRSNKSK